MADTFERFAQIRMYVNSLALALALLLFSCGGGRGDDPLLGKGDRHYGGVFNTNETEEIRSIFPLSLSQASAHRIANQVYQGLVRLDVQDLSVRPCLAESWEVDPEGKVYTFHLRKYARFHDDPCFPDGEGRPLTAGDVAYCFTQLCTNRPDNQLFWLFQDHVAGANEHYLATANGGNGAVKGIEVLDEHTLRITLEHPMPTFLQVLAHQGCWIFPKEADERYGEEMTYKAVGTGPFRLRTFRRGEVVILERNDRYWEVDTFGNPLPYLDAVRITLGSDKDKELEQFRRGVLTAISDVPGGLVAVADSIDPLTGERRFLVRSMPGLSTQFYGFNSTRPPFDDIRVRKAFTMAIDKRFIVDSVLLGSATPALGGFVAPGMNGYPYGSVKGIAYDPDRARDLLAEAGYPNGEGFPSMVLQVNNNDVNQVRVSIALQDMIGDVLGIPVAASMMPSDQLFDRVERNQADLWREGWIADFPDPENFLAVFFGKNAAASLDEPSFLNTTRYKDRVFDSLFTAASSMKDVEKRMQLLAAADQRMIADAVVLPLYHVSAVRLEQLYVRGFPMNPMDHRDLGSVWFDPVAKAAVHVR